MIRSPIQQGAAPLAWQDSLLCWTELAQHDLAPLSRSPHLLDVEQYAVPVEPSQKFRGSRSLTRKVKVKVAAASWNDHSRRQESQSAKAAANAPKKKQSFPAHRMLHASFQQGENTGRRTPTNKASHPSSNRLTV